MPNSSIDGQGQARGPLFDLVRLPGLEPATFRSGGSRSRRITAANTRVAAAGDPRDGHLLATFSKQHVLDRLTQLGLAQQDPVAHAAGRLRERSRQGGDLRDVVTELDPQKTRPLTRETAETTMGTIDDGESIPGPDRDVIRST